jgi:hypothetical protein
MPARVSGMRDDGEEEDGDDGDVAAAATAIDDGESRLLASPRCRRLCGWPSCSGFFAGAIMHCLQVRATGRGRMAFQWGARAQERIETKKKEKVRKKCLHFLIIQNFLID